MHNSHSRGSTVLSLSRSLSLHTRTHTYTRTHIDFLLQQTKINNDFTWLIKHDHFGEERGCLHWINQTWSNQFSESPFSLITPDLIEARLWYKCNTQPLSELMLTFDLAPSYFIIPGLSVGLPNRSSADKRRGIDTKMIYSTLTLATRGVHVPSPLGTVLSITSPLHSPDFFFFSFCFDSHC